MINEIAQQSEERFAEESIEIYERIVKKENKVPQLSIWTLFFHYYDYVEDILKQITSDLFCDYLGTKIVMDELDDIEYEEVVILLNTQIPQIEVEITQIVFKNWVEYGLHFSNAAVIDSDCKESHNCPIQGVW